MTLPKISEGVLAYFISIGVLGLAEYFALEMVMWISLLFVVLGCLKLLIVHS